MGLDERVIYLLLGSVIGFFLGYVTRALREIKEEVHQMHDNLVAEDSPHERDEGGSISFTKIREKITYQQLQKVALFLVVFLTAFASWQSQVASNNAQEALDRTVANQNQLERVVGCIIINQTELLDAVNTRTGYTQTQAAANKKLQEAQKVFFGVLLHIPPYTQTVKNDAARDYQQALNDFLDAANDSENNAKITQYPEAVDLRRCIREEKSDSKG